MIEHRFVGFPDCVQQEGVISDEYIRDDDIHGFNIIHSSSHNEIELPA